MSDRLSSSNVELLASTIILRVYEVFVLGLAHRNVGRVAQRNAFEGMFSGG